MPQPRRASGRGRGHDAAQGQEEQRRGRNCCEPSESEGYRDCASLLEAPGDVDVSHDSCDVAANKTAHFPCAFLEQLHRRHPRYIPCFALISTEIKDPFRGDTLSVNKCQCGVEHDYYDRADLSQTSSRRLVALAYARPNIPPAAIVASHDLESLASYLQFDVPEGCGDGATGVSPLLRC